MNELTDAECEAIARTVWKATGVPDESVLSESERYFISDCATAFIRAGAATRAGESDAAPVARVREMFEEWAWDGECDRASRFAKAESGMYEDTVTEMDFLFFAAGCRAARPTPAPASEVEKKSRIGERVITPFGREGVIVHDAPASELWNDPSATFAQCVRADATPPASDEVREAALRVQHELTVAAEGMDFFRADLRMLVNHALDAQPESAPAGAK